MVNTKDNSTIYKLYNGFIASASTISNFVVGQKQDVDYDITDLANKYVQYRNINDNMMCDAYFSALMIRYWHMIAQIHKTLKPYGVSVEEVVTILYESINKAFRYQSWLDETKHVSKEIKGAEKVINQCITSTVSNYIKAFNVKKEKLFDNLVSIEDAENDFVFRDSYSSLSGCKLLINALLDRQEYLLAMIVDLISFRDCTSKKVVLNKILLLQKNSSYFKEFVKLYSVKNDSKFFETMNNFVMLSDKNKSREITKAIKQLSNNEKFVRSFVC